jgi:hypothetical protein
MKKMLFFCYCISLSCFAQKEAYQWTFADSSGINFNNNTWFESSTNSKDFNFIGSEGVASISDAQGNLLFYTSSQKVWNKNHQVMVNGENLTGSFTTTQTIIIPQPNSSRYYIFTANPQFNAFTIFTKGFHYSVVDMSLEDGLGAVLLEEKNILLFRNTTEKMAATRHANGVDYWLVAHEEGNNHFRSYLITSNGLQTQPIISSVGSPVIDITPNGENAVGQMKISPNGKMIALSQYFSNILEVAYFNTQTGKISNIRTSPIGSKDFENIYGLEFSSNNRKLYVSSEAQIRQLDLEQENIFNNPSIIYNPTIILFRFFQLQLAPDGRIYIAGQDKKYLSTINFPNELGLACGLELESFF